ncbi:MAG: helix-turn-helix transcriptional regulator [Algicola sp.]|nr:helix-turn-helix transcriptional regulator [Algicola sp.]
MINNKAFVDRLQQIIDYYSESASSFAEKIGVQRSSISHIISGRNKPSLDFIMKILDAYPEVGLYWLLNGKGTFPQSPTHEETLPPTPAATNTATKEDAPNLFSQIKNAPKGKTIERIVIFYNDGSFKSYLSDESLS